MRLGVCVSGLGAILSAVLTVPFPLFKAAMIPPPPSSGASVLRVPHPVGMPRLWWEFQNTRPMAAAGVPAKPPFINRGFRAFSLLFLRC